MERIAATRLRHFGGWINPRAVTATRPLPGANIQTCRYAAARRYAPFLLWRILCGGQSSSCALFFMKCINARGAALVSVIQ